jgi:hypothetical protein
LTRFSEDEARVRHIMEIGRVDEAEARRALDEVKHETTIRRARALRLVEYFTEGMRKIAPGAIVFQVLLAAGLFYASGRLLFGQAEPSWALGLGLAALGVGSLVSARAYHVHAKESATRFPTKRHQRA